MATELAIDVAILAAIFTAVIVIHLWIVGRVPTGSDPGNWLALGRKLLGEQAMAADVVYPPMVPSMLAALSWFVFPIKALVIVGVAARLAVGVALYVVLRPTGRATAAFGVILALTAGYQSEIFAFGGYPQLLATASAVLAVNALVRYLRRPQRTTLVAVLVLALLTAVTHAFSTAVLFGSAAVGVLAVLVLGQVAGGFRTVLRGILAFAPAVATFAIWLLSPSLSGEPTLNPQRFGYNEAPELLGSFVRESTWAWSLLILGALAAIGLGLYRRRVNVPVEAMAWIISGGLIWAIFLEHRSLAFVQIGIIIAVATLPSLLAAEDYSPRVAAMAFAAIAAVGLVAAVQGIQRFDETAYYYRVVDADDLWTLRAMADMSEPGDVVLSTRGRNDHHLGWWIQGYAGVPTFTAANPSYLTFPDEKQQADIALEVFRGEVGPGEFLALAEANGIEFVVVDKRGPDAAWLATPTAQSLTPVMDWPHLAILRVP